LWDVSAADATLLPPSTANCMCMSQDTQIHCIIPNFTEMFVIRPEFS